MSIRLNPDNLSHLVWTQWFEAIEEELPIVRAWLTEAFQQCEATRQFMAYNTGSISVGSAFSLYAAARILKPAAVFEVGTFIGKSLVSIGYGMERAGVTGQIFTCDGSNAFHLPQILKAEVHPGPNMTSTSALQQAEAAGARIDFYHIDGRLNAADLEIMGRISNPNAVIAIDDFEGMEKGVANLTLLRQSPFFGRHALVYPAARGVLERIGVITRSTTALMVPIGLFQITNQ